MSLCFAFAKKKTPNTKQVSGWKENVWLVVWDISAMREGTTPSPSVFFHIVQERCNVPGNLWSWRWPGIIALHQQVIVFWRANLFCARVWIANTLWEPHLHHYACRVCKVLLLTLAVIFLELTRLSLGWKCPIMWARITGWGFPFFLFLTMFWHDFHSRLICPSLFNICFLWSSILN